MSYSSAWPKGPKRCEMDGSSLAARGRLRSALALAALAVATTLGALLSGGPTTGLADDPPDSVPGQLIVAFKPTATDKQEQKAVDRVDATVEQRIESIDGALVSVDPDETDAAAEELTRQRAVQFVEPNYVLHAHRLPNDRLFGEQWGLRNVGQYGGKAGADIHATDAWDVTTGAGVTVAVVDTGIDFQHSDLAANAWNNPADPQNGVDDDHNGFVDDVHGADFVNEDSNPSDDAGHGTHVAGIIGARGNNASGVSGVNWDAKLMGLKFLDADGEGNTADAANAIDYAVSHGARVINASWGGPAFSQALYQAVRRAGDKGVLFIAAAGNDGHNADTKPDYPAAFDLPNVISVAATDAQDHLVDFSNYGVASVDLAAPGDDIESTVPPATDSSGYASFSGTSMATPFVAGAAALYLSKFPQATADQVRNAILQNVDKLPSLAGKVSTGGRLDIARMLGAAAPQTTPEPDHTPPAPFALLRPHNKRHLKKRKQRFLWQRSRDASGIHFYKLYMNGHSVKTIKDPDGRPGGKDPKPRVKARLTRGRHRWYVRAYDYAGNFRTSRTFRRGRYSKSSVFFIGAKHHKSKRHRKGRTHSGPQKIVAHLAH
jgi:subtilisin family serine protease